MKKNRGKFYQIMIITSLSSRIRKINIPRFILPLSLSFVLLFLSYTAFISIKFIDTNKTNDELEELKLKNRSQKVQLLLLAEKISDLEAYMNKIKRMDHKLRAIFNIEPLTEDRQILGVGGPSPDDLSLIGNLDRDQKIITRKMHYDLETLQQESSWVETSLHELQEFFEDQKSILSSTPSIKPTQGWLTSGFGYRICPFTGLKMFHKGMDIAASTGTPVIAPADGVVIWIGRKGNYGKMLVIDHGYGYTSRYGHTSRIITSLGERVKRGQKIAEVGNTGRSTGPHLHYEVRVKGVPTDPRKFVLVE